MDRIQQDHVRHIKTSPSLLWFGLIISLNESSMVKTKKRTITKDIVKSFYGRCYCYVYLVICLDEVRQCRRPQDNHSMRQHRHGIFGHEL